MRKLRVLAATALIAVGLIGGTALVSADAPDGPVGPPGPFLCPVVGDGVLNADDHNGDNGVATITPPAGTSLLPGNNQAGANANPSSYNSDAPSDPDAGPGGNPDFSPIWPSG